MIKRLVVAVSLIIAAGIFAGCAPKQAAVPEKKEELQVIGVGSSGGYYSFTFIWRMTNFRDSK